MDKVVVVMSTYNGEKYLRQQIDSIFQQKDVEVQLVIRDDGSKDNTYSILQEYKHLPNIIIIPQEGNCGYKLSFITALRSAPESKYYAFADQDDVWDSNKLFDGVKQLEKLDPTRPNLYVSNSWVTDSELNKLFKFREKNIDLSELTPYEIWVHPDIQGGCGQVFNCEAKERALQVYNYPRGHDSLIERVCGLMGTIIYDQTPHFLYRQHPGNTIGAKMTMMQKIQNRWKKTFGPYVPSDSIAAQCFLDAFEQELDLNVVRFLKLCRDAHSSISARTQLITWKGLKKQTIDADVAFRIKILMGKY